MEYWVKEIIGHAILLHWYMGEVQKSTNNNINILDLAV